MFHRRLRLRLQNPSPKQFLRRRYHGGNDSVQSFLYDRRSKQSNGVALAPPHILRIFLPLVSPSHSLPTTPPSSCPARPSSFPPVFQMSTMAFHLFTKHSPHSTACLSHEPVLSVGLCLIAVHRSKPAEIGRPLLSSQLTYD